MKKKWMSELAGWLLAILGPLAVVLVLTSSLFAIATVNQESMQPGLVQGDVLYCSRFVGADRLPDRGDVVLFYADGRIRQGFLFDLKQRLVDLAEVAKPAKSRSNLRYVKRVIGLPGETIDIVDGRVVVDGVTLDEPYVRGETFRNGMTLPTTVPEGKLLLLGDNREFSIDSRQLGMIDIGSVEGIARFQMWPLPDLSRNPGYPWPDDAQ